MAKFLIELDEKWFDATDVQTILKAVTWQEWRSLINDQKPITLTYLSAPCGSVRVTE